MVALLFLTTNIHKCQKLGKQLDIYQLGPCLYLFLII